MKSTEEYLSRSAILYEQFLVLSATEKPNYNQVFIQAAKTAKGYKTPLGEQLLQKETRWAEMTSEVDRLRVLLTSPKGHASEEVWDVESLLSLAEEMFSDAFSYHMIGRSECPITNSTPAVDFDEVDSLFMVFTRLDKELAAAKIADGVCIRKKICQTIGKLCDTLQSFCDSYNHPVLLRFIIIQLRCPYFEDMILFNDYLEILRCVSHCNNNGVIILRQWFVTMSATIMSRVLEAIRLMITVTTVDALNQCGYTPERMSRTAVEIVFDIASSCIKNSLNFLQILWDANYEKQVEYLYSELKTSFYTTSESLLGLGEAPLAYLPYTEFHDSFLNDLKAVVYHDFIQWLRRDEQCAFGFLKHPFVLTTVNKASVLQWECQVTQRIAVSRGIFAATPYLLLRVRRNHLLEDALNQLVRLQAQQRSNTSHYLKRPIKVQFLNEPGVDEGGLSKEFFQLLTDQLFNPDFGMFTYIEEYRCFWFNRNSLEPLVQFELIGIILGLALYNGIILDVKFPRVVYKKLLCSLECDPTKCSDEMSLVEASSVVANQGSVADRQQSPSDRTDSTMLVGPAENPPPVQTTPLPSPANEQAFTRRVNFPHRANDILDGLNENLPLLEADALPGQPHTPLDSAPENPFLNLVNAIATRFAQHPRAPEQVDRAIASVLMGLDEPFYPGGTDIGEILGGDLDVKFGPYIPTLEDFDDWKPEVGKSLRHVLHCSEKELEEMELTFSVTEYNFGVHEEIVLPCPPKYFLSKILNTADVSLLNCQRNADEKVTTENREEYVSTYLYWSFVTSAQRQFEAFYNGFHRVCGGGRSHALLKAFDAEELELSICGAPGDLDFVELATSATYQQGYTAESQTVMDFWDVCSELDQTEKKKLLTFITGSDRVPLGGMKKLHLVVGRSGEEKERLPSSHTCYNYLLLPDYKDKEILRKRLKVAIHHCQGFGLR